MKYIEKFNPYNKNNPIRKIEFINYVKEPTNAYCGQATIAMITGVSVFEIIKMTEDEEKITKAVLKKVLDYYGINYAKKSIKYDPNKPLPDLCIIKSLLPGYGHWSLYFKGKFYDPEFGVLDKNPENAKIFQVWEIYP
ncbi:hypothetical protein LJB90_02670 [Eubacteriales bacterium OttesenSCG-928-G02]|nr:hypothetical protein [Eubacteriales bacterium OttesenSCG-928-G02]